MRASGAGSGTGGTSKLGMQPLTGQALDEQILGLAAPALVTLCAEPLLSIIDTGFVGRLPDAALCLAGLAAANAVFDFVFRAYNFLCVVLVPLVAQAVVARGRGDPDAADPAQITGRALGFAAFLGAITCTGLILGAPNILQLAGAAPGTALGDVAASYLVIRSASLPASLMNTVAAGSFRGNLDTATPLAVVGVQTIANIVLAAVLVFGVQGLGVPAMGVQGAALSTFVAVWLACGTSCFLLTQRGLVRWESAFSWPSAFGELLPLIEGGLAQFARSTVLQVALLQFTKTVTTLDPSGLLPAAHQVAIRTWFFALFALDSIAVAAQGLVPTTLASFGRQDARRVADRLLRWGFGGGALCGLLLGAGAAHVPAVFTDDPGVQEAAVPLIALVAALQPLAGLVFTWDGIFQGLSDYNYLAAAMAVSSLLTLFVLQDDAFSNSLPGVWLCFCLLLFGRFVSVAWRYWGPGPLSDTSKD